MTFKIPTMNRMNLTMSYSCLFMTRTHNTKTHMNNKTSLRQKNRSSNLRLMSKEHRHQKYHSDLSRATQTNSSRQK